MPTVLLVHRPASQKNVTRYFMWQNDSLQEATASQVAAATDVLICHEYSSFCNDIFGSAGRLPRNIIELEHLEATVSGCKKERQEIRTAGIFRSGGCVPESDVRSEYQAEYHGARSINSKVYERFARIMYGAWLTLISRAAANGELQRFVQIEQPIFAFLHECCAKGINLNRTKAREFKQAVEIDYFTSLKQFAVKYQVPFEVPTNGFLRDYFGERGFDFDEDQFADLLDLLPATDDFGVDLKALRKIRDSRDVLVSVPLSRRRLHPLVFTTATATSRIYFQDPTLQNLRRKYRRILSPDVGMEFSYIDYNEFEVGVMAALSGDSKLLSMYAGVDAYALIALELSGDVEKRKYAKRLFLSFAYGMSSPNLLNAAHQMGAERRAVTSYFGGFSRLDEWKQALYDRALVDGRIGTELGNYRNRDGHGSLGSTERRRIVSQVVQGTASLVFKKALLALRECDGVLVKVPMHDAVLVQHESGFDAEIVVRIMESTMTEHFKGSISGKASIQSYFDE